MPFCKRRRTTRNMMDWTPQEGNEAWVWPTNWDAGWVLGKVAGIRYLPTYFIGQQETEREKGEGENGPPMLTLPFRTMNTAALYISILPPSFPSYFGGSSFESQRNLRPSTLLWRTWKKNGTTESVSLHISFVQPCVSFQLFHWKRMSKKVEERKKKVSWWEGRERAAARSNGHLSPPTLSGAKLQN